MAKSKGRSLANGEQQLIPEIAPTKIPRIHTAAKRYAQRRDERQAANREEKAAHEFLLEAMIAEGLDSYVYGDCSVFVDKSTKCKVKIGAEVSQVATAEGDGE